MILLCTIYDEKFLFITRIQMLIKKITALLLISVISVSATCACGKTAGSQTSESTYTGTVPPEISASTSLTPGSVKYVADKDSGAENAIRIQRLSLNYVELTIGDKYMDTDGKIYTVTAIGVSTSHPVYASENSLLITLRILGGNTRRIGATAFQGATELSNVYIGNGVETIGDYAFYLCPNLTILSLPDTLTEIGAAAFSRAAIKELTIPQNVVKIGVAAFSNCPNLQKVTLPSRFNDPQVLRSIFANVDGIEFVFSD
jgi:hypothetical protein